jgi:hypothetical protein
MINRRNVGDENIFSITPRDHVRGFLNDFSLRERGQAHE